MALLLSTIVHFASFLAVLVYGIYNYIPIGSPVFWRYFFALYVGISAGIIGLGINQLRNFFSTFDDEYAKKKDKEGYETRDLSVNAYTDTGESGESYDLEHYMGTLAERRS